MNFYTDTGVQMLLMELSVLKLQQKDNYKPNAHFQKLRYNRSKFRKRGATW